MYSLYPCTHALTNNYWSSLISVELLIYYCLRALYNLHSVKKSIFMNKICFENKFGVWFSWTNISSKTYVKKIAQIMLLCYTYKLCTMCLHKI